MKIFLNKSRVVGIVLGLLTLIFWVAAPYFPEFVEHSYARFLYPHLMGTIAFFGALIPIPLTSIIFVTIALWLVLVPLLHFRRRIEGTLLKEKLFVTLGFSLASYLAIFGTLFFLLAFSFLFNHQRYSEEAMYDLDFELDDGMNAAIDQYAAHRANELVYRLEENFRGCSDLDFDLGEYDGLIQGAQSEFLEAQGLPYITTGEIKYFIWSTAWSGGGISGQFQPLVGQPNIASTVSDFYKPYVMAHERGHLNGFASEAGATLLAMQTLFHAFDIRLQYLGALHLLRKSRPGSLKTRVIRDLNCWDEDHRNMKRFSYRDLVRSINNRYLKMSGHKDGVKSYGRGDLLARKYFYLNFVKPLEEKSQPSDERVFETTSE